METSSANLALKVPRVTRGISWLWVTFGCLITLSVAQYDQSFDLRGDYCRTRTGRSRCCDGRVDSCSLPILGTLCYCDKFCDRNVNPDCCPDYWDVCLGRRPNPPPAPLTKDIECYLDSLKIPHLGSALNNCNTCKCNYGTLTCELDQCLIDQEFLSSIQDRSRELGWTASNYSFFWGKKLDEGLLMMTGTLPPDEKSMKMHPIKLHYDDNQLPKSFDARRRWKGLGDIRNQGWCASSWAFSTVAVAQDRLAIASGGAEEVDLSTQNLLSCNRKGQQACNGGHVERAWGYLRKIGIVTEDCFPYVSGADGSNEKCKVPRYATLQSVECHKKKFPMDRTELYTTEPAYRIASNEGDIMWELMTNGPVQAVMRVYRDFFLYSGGIYSRKALDSNVKFSVHSVKILGWGEESKHTGEIVKYWLAANSWGTSWGENGYFRIQRNRNESDIEQFILAVRPHLSEDVNNISRGKNRRFGRNRRHQRHRF